MLVALRMMRLERCIFEYTYRTARPRRASAGVPLRTGADMMGVGWRPWQPVRASEIWKYNAKAQSGHRRYRTRPAGCHIASRHWRRHSVGTWPTPPRPTSEAALLPDMRRCCSCFAFCGCCMSVDDVPQSTGVVNALLGYGLQSQYAYICNYIWSSLDCS